METMDIWVQCFFGGTDSLNRRLCHFDGHYGTNECWKDCPWYLTKRDAIDICRDHLKKEVKTDEL